MSARKRVNTLCRVSLAIMAFSSIFIVSTPAHIKRHQLRTFVCAEGGNDNSLSTSTLTCSPGSSRISQTAIRSASIHENESIELTDCVDVRQMHTTGESEVLQQVLLCVVS